MVPGRPFAIFSLLQHEHKKTVLNFTVQRNTEYDGSVRSKVIVLVTIVHPMLTFVVDRTPSSCVSAPDECG